MQRPYIIASIALIAAVTLAFIVPANAATFVQIFNGGTATTTAPSYGKLLIGGKNGEYEFVASSTLGSGGGSSASSTLLSDNNTFSGLNSFTGQVTMGTTTPLGNFETTIGGNGNLFIDNVANNVGLVMNGNLGNSTYFGINASNAANTASKNLVLEQYSGNVGVGTTSPWQTLSVNGGAAITGSLYLSSTTMMTNNVADYLVIQNRNSSDYDTEVQAISPPGQAQGEADFNDLVNLPGGGARFVDWDNENYNGASDVGITQGIANGGTFAPFFIRNCNLNSGGACVNHSVYSLIYLPNGSNSFGVNATSSVDQTAEMQIASGTAPTIFEADTNPGTHIFQVGASGATTTNFAITGITNSILATNGIGQVVATTSIRAASSTLLSDNNSFSGATTTFKNAVSLWTSSDQFAIPELSCGLGNNNSNFCISISGGRGMIGFDSLFGDLVLAGGNGKGISMYVNSPTNVFPNNGSGGTDALRILPSGNVGIGTTTPGSLFSIAGIGNWTGATSTMYSTGGINLTAGCFSVGGVCVGSTAASSTLLTDNNTFGGNDTFTNTTNLTNGFLSAASSTVVGNLALPNGITFGYNPWSIYEDSYQEIWMQPGNPGYYAPRAILNLVAPDANPQESTLSFTRKVNTGNWTGTSYGSREGADIGCESYDTGSGTSNGIGAADHACYFENWAQGTGTTTPIRIGSWNMNNEPVVADAPAIAWFDRGASTTASMENPTVAIGNYASTTNAAFKYDASTTLQVLSTTTQTAFAVETSPRAHNLFVVRGNGNVGIGTSTPQGILTITKGASATTTVSIGELGLSTSKACVNIQTSAGTAGYFYLNSAGTIVSGLGACTP